MSALLLSEEEKILYDKIERSGIEGVAKSEVVKSKRQEAILEKLIELGLVVCEKKGRGLRLWTRENHQRRAGKGAAPTVDISTLYEEIQRVKEALRDLPSIKEAILDLTQKVDALLALSQKRIEAVTLEVFKQEVDRAISEVGSPTGWAELAEVRRVVCARLSISRDEFYEFVTKLVDASPGEYEFSPGGNEGVTLRGTLYGLIRRR